MNSHAAAQARRTGRARNRTASGHRRRRPAAANARQRAEPDSKSPGVAVRRPRAAASTTNARRTVSDPGIAAAVELSSNLGDDVRRKGKVEEDASDRMRLPQP